MRRPADNPFASRRIDGLSYRFHHSDIDELIATIAAVATVAAAPDLARTGVTAGSSG